MGRGCQGYLSGDFRFKRTLAKLYTESANKCTSCGSAFPILVIRDLHARQLSLWKAQSVVCGCTALRGHERIASESALNGGDECL
jgi:hypothetical protein